MRIFCVHLLALEAIAFGEQRIRTHLKQQGTEEAMLAIKEEFKMNDDVCIAAQSVIDAVNREDTVSAVS
jgi:hypothetical protein